MDGSDRASVGTATQVILPLVEIGICSMYQFVGSHVRGLVRSEECELPKRDSVVGAQAGRTWLLDACRDRSRGGRARTGRALHSAPRPMEEAGRVARMADQHVGDAPGSRAATSIDRSIPTRDDRQRPGHRRCPTFRGRGPTPVVLARELRRTMGQLPSGNDGGCDFASRRLAAWLRHRRSRTGAPSIQAPTRRRKSGIGLDDADPRRSLGHPNSPASCAPAWGASGRGSVPHAGSEASTCTAPKAARNGRREPRPARSIRLSGRRSRLRPPRQKAVTRLRPRPHRIVGASRGATVRPRPGRAIVARSPRSPSTRTVPDLDLASSV
jgi:hypothetical protein